MVCENGKWKSLETFTNAWNWINRSPGSWMMGFHSIHYATFPKKIETSSSSSIVSFLHEIGPTSLDFSFIKFNFLACPYGEVEPISSNFHRNFLGWNVTKFLGFSSIEQFPWMPSSNDCDQVLHIFIHFAILLTRDASFMELGSTY